MTARHKGRRHDAAGRSTGVPADSRFRKRLGPPPDTSWIWLTRELLESAAYRSLSHAACRVLSRLMLEHLAHGGFENGCLPCTYSDFQNYGIRRASVAGAIRELVSVGLVAVVVKGGRCYGTATRPSLYRLTWIATREGSATNEWKAFHEIAPDAKTERRWTQKRA